MGNVDIEVFPTCKAEALALAYVLKMDKTVTKPEEIVEIYEDALEKICKPEDQDLIAAIQAGNIF